MWPDNIIFLYQIIWLSLSYLFSSKALTNNFGVFTNQKIIPGTVIVMANSYLF